MNILYDNIFPRASQLASDFIADTSNHQEMYVLATGLIASFYLLQHPIKAASLVARCTSLYVASQLLYHQRNEPWEKIAVTAIKTTSIFLGATAVALSSSTLLATSLVFDIASHLGSLFLLLTLTELSNENCSLLITHFTLLFANCLTLGAIVLASPELLLTSLLVCILFDGCNVLFRDRIIDDERINNSIQIIINESINNSIQIIIHGVFGLLTFIQFNNYSMGIYSEDYRTIIRPPIDASTVESGAAFSIPINFHSEILLEWLFLR